jgi:hypothetical protein
LSQKLHELFSKDLYDLALDIVLQPSFTAVGLGKDKKTSELVEATVADTSNLAWETVVEICKRKADYHYSQQEYDVSIQNYIYTIGKLEPSYVIRKYLDAQRLHNLTMYLKELHHKKVATGDHTTLLLNCFTKLNDLPHLIEFIEASDHYDPDTAIEVCRNSGYFQQALQVASKFELHDWYVKILVEDLQQYDDAISFLYTSGPDAVRESITRYGYRLVNNRPEKASKLLLLKFQEDILEYDAIQPLFMNRPAACIEFLDNLLKQKFQIDYNSKANGFNPELSSAESGIVKTIGDMLLDLLLYTRKHLLQSQSKESKAELKKLELKLMSFLECKSIQYDLENALFRCKVHQFIPGQLIANKKLGLFEDCIAIYAANKDFDAIFQLCQDHGDENKHLWHLAIDFCAKNCTSNSKSDEKLIQVLGEIESRKLFSHAEILKILTSNEYITIGMVRSYLIKIMEADLSAIEKVFNIDLGQEQRIKLPRRD